MQPHDVQALGIRSNDTGAEEREEDHGRGEEAKGRGSEGVNGGVRTSLIDWKGGTSS